VIVALLVWLLVGAVIGFLWSRRMSNSGLPDVAAGAASGVLGGLLFFMVGWAGRGDVSIGDIVGPLLFALVGLSVWRVAIGRRV
jgi:uncharacterized membrane protein YeaQ/YmgE (transglycosylase-associated protein family)